MTPLAGKRIVFVLGSLELGGAERQAILLARQLQGRGGAAVEVWGFEHPGGRAAQLCEAHGIPWRHEPFAYRPWRGGRWHWFVQLARLTRALRRARPDVLMPYYALPNVACGLVWRASGARLCVWNQRDEGLRVHPRLESLAARLTPSFIANSPGGARFLHDTFRLASDAVHVIPNGVELAAAREDRAAWRTRLGLSDDHPAACMVANLSRNKDHATALRAWRHVADRAAAHVPPPVLLLAGMDIDTGTELRALVAQLRLDECVRFLGPVDDIPGLLAASDLAVFASPQEGCPNGVLEAMAAGLPVVASDIEGVRRVVGRSGAAHLAPPGDAAALAARVAHLLDDAETRQLAGWINRKRAEREFSPARLYEETVAVLSLAFADEQMRRAA